MEAYFDQLSVSDGMLYREQFTNKGKVKKEYVPVPNEVNISNQCHATPSGGHRRRQKTLANIKQSFYSNQWHDMPSGVHRGRQKTLAKIKQSF